ncbi:Cell division cycle protein 20 -like protein [Halotydeus destructor]|nr:Cell division cycle protein 20 -like protein [Halotydeus destructor]
MNSKLTSSANKLAKTPKTPGGDRFIPNRSALNVEVSHYLINQASKENPFNQPDDKLNGRNALSEALNGDLSGYRIMNCQDRSVVDQARSLKVMYSSHKHLNTVVKKIGRQIPTQPDRILDAPEIVNDYYLQLVDWSDTNLLAVALNREVYLWNANNGEIVNLMQLNEGDYVTSVSWIEGANHLAIGTSMSEVQLWDADASKKLRTMRGHDSRVSSLCWNSYILTSGCRSGTIHHSDVRIASHHVGTVAGHSQEVCGLKWQPGGQYLASGGNDNNVFIWPNSISHAASRPVYNFTQHQAAVKALSWCPWKPSLLATGGGTADRHIRIWNTNNGTEVQSVDTKSQVCALLWSKEYKELISAHGYSNNELVIWKYPALTKFQELTGHTQRVLGMVMSPDGSTVVSVGADETLRFWECFQVDREAKKKADSHVSKENISSSMRLSIR